MSKHQLHHDLVLLHGPEPFSVLALSLVVLPLSLELTSMSLRRFSRLQAISALFLKSFANLSLDWRKWHFRLAIPEMNKVCRLYAVTSGIRLFVPFSGLVANSSCVSLRALLVSLSSLFLLKPQATKSSEYSHILCFDKFVELQILLSL